MVVKPSGYISKMGLEGTRSETGPYMMDVSRKSYTLGAWSRIRSGFDIGYGPPWTMKQAAHRPEKTTAKYSTGDHCGRLSHGPSPRSAAATRGPYSASTALASTVSTSHPGASLTKVYVVS